jgi:hypothetical protein
MRLLKKCAGGLFTQIQSVPPAGSSPSSAVATGLAEARRHELDKFRERVAAVEPEFRSTLSKEEKPFWRAGDGVGKRRIRPQLLCARFGDVTLGILKKDESGTLVSN